MHYAILEVDACQSRAFLNTPYGKKTVHVLGNESKKLGLLIQRLTERKVEVDEMLQMLRGSSS